jgi:histidine ammonia-lyase
MGRVEKTVQVDGRALDCAAVSAIARDGAVVTVTGAAMDRARAANATVTQVSAEHAVYGRTTGVGVNRSATADRDGHGLRLLRSHAGGAGPTRPPEIARAMLAVRLNQLASGGSGVAPQVLEDLAVVINAGLVPVMRRYGAIGTGDLTALATTALCLLGERPWDGGLVRAFPLADDDALAFISSNAATIGEAALACFDLQRLLDATLTVAALSAVAYGASSEPFSQPVQAARAHAGQAIAAARMRALLGSSYGPGKRIQDSYGFRALPQVHGPAIGAARHLDEVVTVDMNSASENPLVDTAAGRVWHNGNFHTGYLALALDGAAGALAQVGALSVARLANLLAGPPPFLASGPGGSSGLLIAEYIAHSALADVRHQAMPLPGGPVALSLGTEDHAPFTTLTAGRFTACLKAYPTVLACELVAAVRAIRQRAVEVPSPLRRAWVIVREALDADVSDRCIESDLDAAIALMPGLADV